MRHGVLRLVRASRAYIAGFGTSTVLVASTLLLFLVVSALVAFKAWPGSGLADAVSSLLVDDGRPGLIVDGPTQVALDAAPAAAAVGAAAVPAGPPASGGVAGVAASSPAAPPVTSGGGGTPRSVIGGSRGTQVVAGGGPSQAPSQPTSGGSLVDGVGGTTEGLTDGIGRTVGGLNPALGDAVTDTGKALSDLVQGVDGQP